MLHFYLFPAIMILLSQAGDYLSTKWALSKSGTKELNPFVAKVGLLPLKLIGVAIFNLLIAHLTLTNAWHVSLVILLAYSAVTGNNIYQGLRVKK